MSDAARPTRRSDRSASRCSRRTATGAATSSDAAARTRPMSCRAPATRRGSGCRCGRGRAPSPFASTMPAASLTGSTTTDSDGSTGALDRRERTAIPASTEQDYDRAVTTGISADGSTTTASATAPDSDMSGRTFEQLFDAITANVATVVHGKTDADRAGGDVPARRGPPAHRGRARASARPASPRRSPRRSTARGSACSSRPTCCRPTSSASASTSGRPRRSASSPARCSPTSCSPTRSTGPRRRRSRRCSRRWRSARSPSTA